MFSLNIRRDVGLRFVSFRERERKRRQVNKFKVHKRESRQLRGSNRKLSESLAKVRRLRETKKAA